MMLHKLALLSSALFISLLPAQPPVNMSLLSGRIWRIDQATSPPPKGSIYVFLSNGMLLETSCVETYRVARWESAKQEPRVLRVIEDGRLAFTARITELTRSTLRFERKLARGEEQGEMRLSAINKEFVCPDMPK